MSHFFQSLGNAVVDRTPDELIGAVVIALGLSLVFAGLDLAGRRNVRDTRMPMMIFMIIANLVSMAVAAGYVLHASRSRGPAPVSKMQTAMLGAESPIVANIFRAADTNRDGLLSSDEASIAAADFVRGIDTTGKGLIDKRSLDRALPGAMFHLHGGPDDDSMTPFSIPFTISRSRRNLRPQQPGAAPPKDGLRAVDQAELSSPVEHVQPGKDQGKSQGLEEK